jgi:hypothetical protein
MQYPHRRGIHGEYEGRVLYGMLAPVRQTATGICSRGPLQRLWPSVGTQDDTLPVLWARKGKGMRSYADYGVASVITNQDEEDDKPINNTGLPFDGHEEHWPHLRVRMKAQGEVKADVCAPICSLIVAAPISHANGNRGNPRLLYCECLLTSELTANALMGMTVEAKGQVNWFYIPPGYEPDSHHLYNIEPPLDGAPQNVRIDLRSVLTSKSLAMPTGHAALQHVAIIEREDVLALTENDIELWRKVRERCTCPSMESWGSALAGRLVDAGVVIPCFGFGWPEGLRAHAFAQDADARFDELVSEHVLKNGLK